MNPLKLISKFFTGNGQSFGAWQTTWSQRRDREYLVRLYRNLVYTCIGIRARGVAKYTPYIKSFDRNGNEIKSFSDKYLDILYHPHPDWSLYEFLEAINSFLDLTGNAYIYQTVGETTGFPKTYQPMRPDRVMEVIDGGKVVGYTFLTPTGEQMPLELEEVIHLKLFNPHDDIRGLGPTEANLVYIDIGNMGSEFQANFLANQATPSGIITVQGNVSKPAFDKLKKQWKERYSGPANAGKTTFIRKADVTYTKIGLSLGELDMAELKTLSKEDVLEAFQVPEILLGKTDTTGLGRNNVEAIEYIFTKYVIDEIQCRFDQIFSRIRTKTFPWLTGTISHVSQVTEDKEFKLKEREASVDKWKTRNELRQEDGQTPKDGGDELYYGFNMTSGDQLDADIEKNLKAVTIKVIKKKSIDNLFAGQKKVENQAIRKYQVQLKELLETQQRQVEDQVRTLGKGVSELAGTLFTFVFTNAEIASLVSILLASLKGSGELAFKFFDQPDLEFLLDQATRDAVFAATERQLKSFNEQTALLIQKQLAAGLANGETIEELTKRIESVYDEAKGYRAKRIAKTEAHEAVNAGAAEAYRQLGYTKLTWVIVGDTCEFCRAMAGKTVEIGQPFVVQGDSVAGVDGGSYKADYQAVRYANLHPECDCRLEPTN